MAGIVVVCRTNRLLIRTWLRKRPKRKRQRQPPQIIDVLVRRTLRSWGEPYMRVARHTSWRIRPCDLLRRIRNPRYRRAMPQQFSRRFLALRARRFMGAVLSRWQAVIMVFGLSQKRGAFGRYRRLRVVNSRPVRRATISVSCITNPRAPSQCHAPQGQRMNSSGFVPRCRY